MADYKSPVAETQFALQAVDADLGPDLSLGDVRSILDAAGAFAEKELAPLQAVGDVGCVLVDGQRVLTPQGFPAAFAKFAAEGWTGITGAKEFGGQGLPKSMGAAVQEYWCSANLGFAQYGILTHSASVTLEAAASEAQKARYLPSLIAGRWTGVMSLTEPQAGTDVGLIKSRAQQCEDGSHEITGEKIFISAGDHDLVDNIVHLVLAREEGAAKGAAGLSLFIVPKMLVGDGDAGRLNAMLCTRLERKMGIRGSATCAMRYDRARGERVGLVGEGLAKMFIMMNETRLIAGMQGVASAEAAYQRARDYALLRRQGRSPAPLDPSAEADVIVGHPDVARMLLDLRLFTDAGRALALWCASLADLASGARIEAERNRAAGLVNFLTPIVKAYLSDKGFEAAVVAQQVFGGHGYMVDAGMEQIVRDARISQIYEGTNGVQAVDLIGRKLVRDRFGTFDHYLALVREELREANVSVEATERMEWALRAVEHVAAPWRDGTPAQTLLSAAAYDFLHAMGTICLGHMWLKLERCARTGRERYGSRFCQQKEKLARLYRARWLPLVAMHCERISQVYAAEIGDPVAFFSNDH